MKIKKNFLIPLNETSTPLFYIIFLLIIILSAPPRVYPKSGQQELKAKLNSSNSNPSRSGPRPGIEKKNPAAGWGKSSANQGKSGKFERKTGTIKIVPGKQSHRQDQTRQKHNPRRHIKRDRDHRKRLPRCNGNNSYITNPGGGIIEYYDEEYVEPSDSEFVPTSRESDGLAAGPEREYYINDSFSLDPGLEEKIEEYNGKNQIGLETPLTSGSASLTYQLLDALELIQHMEKNIQYYKQQLEAVKNSKLSPAEKERGERFWLERIRRLKESKHKEEGRVWELRSEIAGENKKKGQDW